MTSPRALVTSIGATALAFGITIGSLGGAMPVAAQESTPSAGVADEATTATAAADPRADAYAAFVADVAQQLNLNAAVVDAAIREALKQAVDERQAAGDLTVEEAAAMQAVIDVTDAPLPLGFGGRGSFGGFHGGPGGPGFGPHEGRDDEAGRGGLRADRPAPDRDEPDQDDQDDQDAATETAPGQERSAQENAGS